MRLDDLERLLATETYECVVWPYGKAKNGYGLVKIDGQMRGVHVIAAERRLGPAPAGMEVAHSCRSRACLNYRHLEYKTRRANVADMKRDGTDPSGERNGHARLTWDDVRAIRQSATLSGVEAVKYGVSARHIRAIREGRFWKEPVS